ncbi:MAG TPA: 16S rRNA (cytosine(1402)-N(4))-methyltransferase RsmH [Candidatus Udaeobacter sp.]|nr:16S rRNA (cytosine(1402)-N(4))-methyltransferase RsmH [Candidatus Udaeobacter sp.]
MKHIPVLLSEAIDSLQLKPNQNVVDCTLGDAGHSEIILQKIAPKGKLLGIDLDAEAVLRSKRFLYNFESRTVIARDNFANLKAIAEKNNFKPVNAILMDLGWSTPQFEERGRGFSFLKDEPLDMRYSTIELQTAADIINSYSESELAGIFKNFGEESLSKEIAKAVASYRKNKKIAKTGELAEIILQVYREKLRTNKEIPWIGGLHPATKVFQALRMEVNHELDNLKKVLPQAVEILAGGGRLAVISFHSLEDRIVKQYFKSIAGKTIKLINKKPLIASEEEIKNNPRARSAKLRVIEKI